MHKNNQHDKWANLNIFQEMCNLTLLKDTLKKSNNNTENMLGILSSFETRLRKLEQTIVPVYNETENLRRRQESILSIQSTLVRPYLNLLMKPSTIIISTI